MEIFNLHTADSYDRIMLGNRIRQFKSYFREMLQNNAQQAIHYMNHENLHFPSLFVLESDIKNSELSSHLSPRNQQALEITKEITSGEFANLHRLSSDTRDTTYPVLKWMLETGYRNDGLSNQYDLVMESVSALLVKVYRDTTVLPAMAEMIFSRHRKGLYIHDLVWAFFESRIPSSLGLIANYLNSVDRKDILLAQKLLSFIPEISTSRPSTPSAQHSHFLQWMQENGSFLRYTGESLHRTPSPIPYVVSLEAKYLCKAISADTGKPLTPFTLEDSTLLESFRGLPQDIRILLSDYSYRLYRQNGYRWRLWLHSPVSEQIKSVKGWQGGIV